MKRKVAVLLAFTMLGGLVACGNTELKSNEGQKEQAALDEEENQVTEKNFYGYEEPITIKVGISREASFSYVGNENASENQWMDLYRNNNIIPEILFEVDSGQAETKMSTAIMSGNYPDILEATKNDFVNYAKTDVIADITDVFEEYATEELREYLNADGGLAMQSVMLDGRMYGIPHMGNSYDTVNVMFIRQDWLDNLNLEIPTTMEQLKEVAYAFTYNDPDQNGENDTYGLAIDGVNVLNGSVGDASAIFEGFGAYPGTDGMAFVEDEDGKVTWGGTNADGMKAGLQLLQDMYKDGTLAKDFITMDSNTIFEEAGAGRCGIWFGPMWGGMSAASNAVKSEPDAHIVSAAVPDGLNQGGSKVFMQPAFDKIYCVSSKCENPEVLIKLMNLSVQKLCHPADTEEYFRYAEGDKVNYSGWKTCLTPSLAPLKNYDNYKMESEALATGDTSLLNTEQLSNFQDMKTFLDMKESGEFDPEDATFSTGIGLYTVFGDPQGSYAAIDQMIQNEQFENSAYNFLPTDNMAEYGATLEKLTVETIVKIITGQDVNSYDDFLETWYALGGTSIIEDAQAWADMN